MTFFLKNDVIVPSKSVGNKQKTLEEKEIISCWHLEGHCRKEQDPDPVRYEI